MSKGLRIGAATLVAVVGALSTATASWSQQAETSQQTETSTAKPPPRLVFHLTTGVNADSNRDLQFGTPDRVTTLDTDFALTYAARTRLQSLDVSLGALWRLGDTQRGTQLEPRASLSYSFDNGGTKLSFDSLYSKSPVTLFAPVGLADGTISSTDVTAVNGSVEALDNRFSLQTGMRHSVGVLFTAGTNRRHYINNTDPNVFDNHGRSVSATLQFRPDRSSEFDLTRGYTSTRYDDAVGTKQTQNLLGLGYKRAVSSTLTVNAQIDHVRDPIGTANTFKAGGTLLLPTGSLEALGGVSVRPGHGAQLIGLVRYATTGPVNSLTATLSREMVLTVDNNDLAYLRFALDYNHKINRVASIGFNVIASHTGKGLLGTATPTDYQSLGLVYTRQLTPAWVLRTGYLFRHVRQSNSATSNSVFVSIGRDFVLFP